MYPSQEGTLTTPSPSLERRGIYCLNLFSAIKYYDSKQNNLDTH